MMSQELLYTSVPPGLIVGVKGYSTVARTADIPAQLVQLLEQNLSDYRYGTEGNPAAVWSHLRIREGLRDLSVLSAQDSSQRLHQQVGRASSPIM